MKILYLESYSARDSRICIRSFSPKLRVLKFRYIYEGSPVRASLTNSTRSCVYQRDRMFFRNDRSSFGGIFVAGKISVKLEIQVKVSRAGCTKA